ncbi:MAG TPA: phosphoribosylamine--glycine ligase [Actinomycetota bacterium]|nr:phosphoribosylamine--glycine ligase [Actinomycetota bacterium]
MRLLVVGGGGREHALVRQLAQSPSVDRVFAAPGNPGIAEQATCLPVAAHDLAGIAAAADRESIDLTVVGPEGPLVGGLVDELESRGHRAFGPRRAAARIEGSKAWTKDLCGRYGIPAGRSRAFTEMGPAVEYLDALEPPYVVKADGLAAGKGVVIAESRADAIAALEASLVERVFGPAGTTVLVEEHLQGPEVSAFALTDGRTVLPLVMAQDFKRVGEGDRGPNTGGMGAYSPVPFVDESTARSIWEQVIERAVRAMSSEGVTYRGVLYAGVMLTEDGPKLLEFNARFGDPETEVILPRLDSDLAELLRAAAEGTLAGRRAEWSARACVTVVLASGGYPGRPATGLPISGLSGAGEVEGVVVFHAGTAEREGRVVTSGGRVLMVSGLGADLAQARARAYEGCARISFEGMQFRRDIAQRVTGEDR